MFRIVFFALLLTGAATMAGAADVYRYVDAQGGVHYSDTWVPGSTLIKIDRSAKAGASTSASARTQNKALAAANDHASAEVAKQADERAVHTDVAQAREEQCKQARDSYDKAIRSRRIVKTDKDGQREYLSEADADAYRLQLRTDMQSACGTDTK
jgi:hypothetical protein